MNLALILCLDLVFASLLGAPTLVADETSASSDEAQAEHLLDQGRLDDGIELYEKTLADRPYRNGYLLYNLGNAYVKQGRIGQAVASYLGARALLPRDADVASNLSITLTKNNIHLLPQLPSGRTQPLLIPSTAFTSRELFVVAMVFGFAAALLFLAGALWIRYIKLSLILGSALGAVFLLTLTAGALNHFQRVKWGAVTKSDVPVYRAPGEQGEALLKLIEGTCFAVPASQSHESWLPITLSDGRTGWLAAQNGRIMGQNDDEI